MSSSYDLVEEYNYDILNVSFDTNSKSQLEFMVLIKKWETAEYMHYYSKKKVVSFVIKKYLENYKFMSIINE